MIGIIDYSMGNLRSVQKALEFIGEKSIITGDIGSLNGCSRLILPGVGAFGEGIAALRERGLFDYVTKRFDHGSAILGICLGMQFMLTRSYEDGENAGLGFVKGEVVRFTDGKIPQIGWNEAFHFQGELFCGIPEKSEFYFVHSYYADTPEEFTAAKTEYGVTYASAVHAKNAYGVQFHPEKSGEIGLELLKNFAKLTTD